MDTKVAFSNLPKLIIAALTILVVGTLIALGKVSEGAGLPIISATGVYILTNGVRATKVPRDDEPAPAESVGTTTAPHSDPYEVARRAVGR